MYKKTASLKNEAVRYKYNVSKPLIDCDDI